MNQIQIHQLIEYASLMFLPYKSAKIKEIKKKWRIRKLLEWLE